MDDWRTYDTVAEVYGRVHAPRFAEAARDLVGALAVAEGDRVLDLGTGTGVGGRGGRERRSHGRRGRPFDGDAVGGTPAAPVALVARRPSGRSPVPQPRVRRRDGELRARALREGGDGIVRRSTRPPSGRAGGLHRVVRCARTRSRTRGSSSWRASCRGTCSPRRYAAAAPGHERFKRPAAIEETLRTAGFRRIRTERRRYQWTYGRDELVEGLGDVDRGPVRPEHARRVRLGLAHGPQRGPCSQTGSPTR